jgi:predicted nucleic acid-binding protein
MHIAVIALLVARAGQKDSLSWWDDESLTDAGRFALSKIFPRNPGRAALRLAFESAKGRKYRNHNDPACRVPFLQLVAPIGVVPRTVMQELEAGADIDDAAGVVRRSSWLTVVDDPPVSDSIALWDLGPGESAVLAWALAQGGEAVVDDLQARRCAAALEIPVRGVLGLVITGKLRGVIPAAGPVIQRLREAGMYLSDRVVKRALAKAGE